MNYLNLVVDELFIECINALGKNNVVILSKENIETIWQTFRKNIPIFKGDSRIDWNKIEKKASIESTSLTINILEELLKKPIDPSIYVLWNDASLPIIKTNLNTVLEHFDDVTCLCFETWLYNPQQGYIIEYYYLKEMNTGLIPKIKDSLN